MKVYILTKEAFPYGMAATNRIKCLAWAIKQEGIECEVNIFQRTDKRKRCKNLYNNGIFKDIPFVYISSTTIRSSNRYIAKLFDIIDMIRYYNYLKQNLNKGDIVLGYLGTSVIYSLILIDLIHKKGAFFTRDLCELPYGTGEETRKNIRNRKIVLEKQIPLCDGLLPISQTLANLARKYCKTNCIINQIPILVNYEDFRLEDRSDETIIPYIFHSGTLYEQKDGILGMIEAFGIAIQKSKSSFKFISTGDINSSPHALEIRELIKTYKLEDLLVFTGYLSEEEMKDYLAKASLVIINKYNTQQNRYCFSTKLGEYLAASKPVILTNVGEAINWLENNKTAYIIEPHDVNLLADAIVHAMLHPMERKRVGKRGAEICKQYFDFREYGPILKEHFYKIIEKNSK